MEHWPQEVELEQLLADRSWQDRRWGSFCQVSIPSSVGSAPCAVVAFAAAGQDLSKACLYSRVKRAYSNSLCAVVALMTPEQHGGARLSFQSLSVHCVHIRRWVAQVARVDLHLPCSDLFPDVLRSGRDALADQHPGLACSFSILQGISSNDVQADRVLPYTLVTWMREFGPKAILRMSYYSFQS